MLPTWNYGVCRAPGLPSPPGSETDILPVTKGECKWAYKCESELELDEISAKLDFMKHSIVKLRSHMVYTSPNTCVEEAALQIEDEGFHSNQERIMIALHRSNCALKCQLHGIIDHMYATRRRIKHYEKQRCQLIERILKMNQHMNLINEFTTSVKLKLGLCIERFEQIKSSKVDNNAFRKMMITNQQNEEAMTRSLVPLHCHSITHCSLALEVKSLRRFLHALYETLVSYSKYFGRISIM